MAVKTLKETTETDTQEFLAEIKLITRLERHTNVLQVLGGYRDSVTGQPILIMDYKEEGTLKDLTTAMAKERRSFTPVQVYLPSSPLRLTKLFARWPPASALCTPRKLSTTTLLPGTFSSSATKVEPSSAS